MDCKLKRALIGIGSAIVGGIGTFLYIKQIETNNIETPIIDNLDQTDDGPYGHEDTMLIFASKIGSLEVVKFLVKNGANCNITNKNGDTALMCASKIGSLDIVKFLFEKGADIKIKNENGDTALTLASNSQDTFEVIQFLFEKGATDDTQNKSRSNALICASSKGELETVRFLVEKYNGDKTKYVNLTDMDRNRTALFFLSMKPNTLETIKFLVDNGADVNIKTKYNETMLMMASRKGQLDTVTYLVETCNVNINEVDDDNRNALGYGNQHTDIIAYLKSKDAT
jgi:ankyrin repeat protein